MSSIPRQLATFAAVLAVLYSAGFIAGQFIDTSHGDDDMGHDASSAPMAEHGGGEGHGPAKAQTVRGLAVAENGLRLVLQTPEVERDRPAELRYAVAGDDGRPVRDFDVSHEKRMHLIVVRRDTTGFQHLHPRMKADGTWTAPIRIREAGSYRVFADFVHDGTATTLAADLRVDGDAELQAMPATTATARTDPYEVTIDGKDVRAGREAELAFRVTRDGRPVKTEPYLGAGGHLVALREGDLAFLHVHPSEHADGAGHDDAVAFASTFPTEGRYRLFLQFQHEGRVQTVAFTQEVR